MGSRGRAPAAVGSIAPTAAPPAAAVPPPVQPGGAAPPPSRGSGRPGGPAAAEQVPERDRYPGDGILAGASAERAAAEAAQDRARSGWPDQPEVSYLEDPSAFQRDYLEARARRARGEEPVPYMTEDATGGLGSRDSGRGFGVEIEFDLGPGAADPIAARAAIAADLNAAGLSRHRTQAAYHASRHAGYTDDPGGWRLESDATVAGEIVSPIMYDEPATWRNLARVCEIVRRHGGVATARTGGHVHVGLSDYDHTPENHTRLVQTVSGYADTLYRMAQNPAAAAHRGMAWCRPNTAPAAGYSSIRSARSANLGHHLGMNLESVRGERADHVEFRMWDGSLNPSVIQSQIKLSLGITAAASRGGYTPPRPQNVGEHRSANPAGRRLRGQEWQEATRGFRSLADTIFHRAADKRQAAALFAVNRWQRRTL